MVSHRCASLVFLFLSLRSSTLEENSLCILDNQKNSPLEEPWLPKDGDEVVKTFEFPSLRGHSTAGEI